MLVTKFIKEIFRNDDNTYCVHNVKVLKSDISQFPEGSNITITGYDIPTVHTLSLELDGQIVIDKKYGPQFKVDSYEEYIDENNIIDYLGSGIIPGIGKVTAKRIYKKFKMRSFEVIEHEPDSLAKVVGISPKKALKIQAFWKEHQALKNLMSTLKETGVSAAGIKRIVKEFGENAEKAISDNPWNLINIKGFDFDTCDKIAEAINRKNENAGLILIDMNGSKRIHAAYIYAYHTQIQNGSLGIYKTDLLNKAKKILSKSNIPVSKITQVGNEMMQDNGFFMTLKKGNKSIVYMPSIYRTESAVAKVLTEKSKPFDKINGRLETEIMNAEAAAGITLHETQREAVRKSFTSNATIITGGPGTGKTSILVCICKTFQALYPDRTIRLLSPTGKAAQRMSEATGMCASTIHSALGMSPDDTPSTEYTLEDDLVIIDEVSMMDIFIAEKLFCALRENAAVIMVGDTDQLPSVGAGAVLHDVIESNVVNTVRLTKTFRQSEGSNIIYNAQMIRDGNMGLVIKKDFRYAATKSQKQMSDYAVKIYEDAVNRYGIDEVVCLCPTKKGDAGVYELNRRIQALINPVKENETVLEHRHTIYHIGDKVMQLVNADVPNGDIGYVIDVKSKNKSNNNDNDDLEEYVLVKYYGGTEVCYYKHDLDQIMLAYAMTIHKSQGSEYDYVIIALDDTYSGMLKRNLLYTAVTRGKKEVYMLGSKDAVKKAITTTETDKRITLLSTMMKQLEKKYSPKSS